jgi:hypothetical protein
MNSSVIQGCFPNGFRQAALRPAPPVAQRAVAFPRAMPFPPPRPASPPQFQPIVQRFGAGTAMQLPHAMASAANRSIGHPLSPAVRQMMESLFSTSFADVRIHIGPHVAAIGATSYTQGANIHFAPGQYAPEHGPGRQRLAYELAHVVQQRTGRTRNPFGSGVAIVNDPRLEEEAQQFARRSTLAPVVQRLKSHAEKLVEKLAEEGEILNIAVDRTSVENFVKDKKKPRNIRIALRDAWNKKQIPKNEIELPDSLIPTLKRTFDETYDFSKYDSDDDEEMALDATIESSKLSTITVVRKVDKTKKTFAVLGLQEAVRILRQAVIRNKIAETLPLGLQLGEHAIELHSPYGNDVYAVGLKKTKTLGELEWASSISGFNWENLARNLDALAKSEEQRLLIRQRIFNVFKGKSPADLTPEEAEAIAAIACDFMKGSANKIFVKAAVKSSGDLTFQQLFTGDTPVYLPAKKGGRAEVSALNEERKKKKKVKI